ncbi:uncharacterized protein BDR25DRAFT_281634 [Lindgomyces ingoldianus]|uniref:Uncharacterized protein n=1 Tax=Lindgomyces ingoldianus TaxID=673940 RepID=A0ACB6R3R9_9PLEO|nr:uncharacterized protein BDR25DRAFT_281634 [Lindgomyces ingoldianus]KAF2473702.1 hypothetical protein BDR25DRAFT_281634 [Lindgomyces ingoldianus]
MADLESYDIIVFGHTAFDMFVIEQWDPESALTKEEQKKTLVRKWMKLGNIGRNPYLRKLDDFDWEIPEHVPQDLLTDNERRVNGQLGVSNGFWVRTWYGSEKAAASMSRSGGEATEAAQTETVSRATADADYRRLWRRAFFDDPDDPDEAFDDHRAWHRSFIFDDDPAAYGVIQRSADEDVAPTGSTPDFIVNVLMHCPDQLIGLSGGHDLSHVDEDHDQNLLVMIADRKACESGWVLQIGLNNRGEVLPGRVRSKASQTSTENANWQPEGIALSETTLLEDTEIYVHRGDGWASD